MYTEMILKKSSSVYDPKGKSDIRVITLVIYLFFFVNSPYYWSKPGTWSLPSVSHYQIYCIFCTAATKYHFSNSKQGAQFMESNSEQTPTHEKCRNGTRNVCTLDVWVSSERGINGKSGKNCIFLQLEKPNQLLCSRFTDKVQSKQKKKQNKQKQNQAVKTF